MKKFLIIDDEEYFAEALAEDFQALGQHAEYLVKIDIEKLKSLKSIDYILLDLKVGSQYSLNFLEEIRSIFLDSKIILMTGYGTISTAVIAIKKGADDYISKPVTASSILSLLNGKKIEGEDQLKSMSLDRNEREYIEFILAQENGNISKAANRLGLHRQSLQRKLKKWTPKN